MRVLLFCVVGCLLVSPLPALAISIDEFGVDTPSSTTSTYTDGGMAGGERDAIVSGNPPPSFVATGGLATFSATGPNLGLAVIAQLVYDGDDNSSVNAYGLTGVDLTAGNEDRFLVSVTSINGPLTLQMRVWESGTAYSTLEIPNVTAEGVYEFEFALFDDVGAGADFTDAKAIGFFVTGLDDLGGGTPNPRTVTIKYIRTRSGPLIQFSDGFENP